jgi:hypothetical protein
VNRRNAAPEAGARGQTPSVSPLDLFSRKNLSEVRQFLNPGKMATSFDFNQL